MKHRVISFIVIAVALGIVACSGGGSKAQIPSVLSPADMSNKGAAAKNNEGVDHLVQGHYEVSEKYFRDAIAAKNNFAEAYFNLGVALDGMGKHEEATDAFKQAQEYGANNPKIAGSELLKKHLGM
jgi:Flp pilus assembly protein TadD